MSAGETRAIQRGVAELSRGASLSRAAMTAIVREIMAGEATPAQIGGLLVGLAAKGETMDEIVGAATAMREAVIPIETTRRPVIDTCGTGGSGIARRNVSTAAALAVAACGVAAAKHGNRGISSKCGSADVLAALGVDITIDPARVGRCVDEVGVGFLFAPSLHPAMRHAAGPRRELGVRTIFNLLGPLTNPAAAGHQLMGVYDPALTETLADVLRALGSQAAYVVHGADGLDELSTTGVNRISALRDGVVATFDFDPAAIGLPRARLDDLLGGAPEQNAAIAREVLGGYDRGPRRDIVLLNAAAALSLESGDWAAGLRAAAEAIDSGAALDTLDNWVGMTNSF